MRYPIQNVPSTSQTLQKINYFRLAPVESRFSPVVLKLSVLVTLRNQWIAKDKSNKDVAAMHAGLRFQLQSAGKALTLVQDSNHIRVPTQPTRAMRIPILQWKVWMLKMIPMTTTWNWMIPNLLDMKIQLPINHTLTFLLSHSMK